MFMPRTVMHSAFAKARAVSPAGDVPRGRCKRRRRSLVKKREKKRKEREREKRSRYREGRCLNKEVERSCIARGVDVSLKRVTRGG